MVFYDYLMSFLAWDKTVKECVKTCSSAFSCFWMIVYNITTPLPYLQVRHLNMPFRLIFDDEQLEDNVNILKSVHGTTSRVYLLPDPKEL